MVDLHRHDEFSFFDGSGKASELAKIAKEKGLTSLALTNHGNTSGLIQHYDACKKEGIKPILGVEGYFLPKYKEQNRGYHIILIAKSLEGYRSINIIQSKGELQKYYNPIIDFNILKENHKDVICCSACVASYSSQMILKGKIDLAIKYLKKMQSIFGDDFYIEIQPYSISEKGIQEKVNLKLIELAKQLKIKMILTSDSHRGRKEDLEAYVMMHRLKNDNEEYIKHIRETYKERYMPDKNEMFDRFVKMHKGDLGLKSSTQLASFMYDNLEEIEEKCSDSIIDDLANMPSLPKFDKSKDSYKLLVQKVKEGLKSKGKNNKEYIQRAKEELEVIKQNNFEDYFLIVQDYTMWAKNNGITVGPGRGSGCNSLVNYALGITETDPIYFDLDFRRFIRENKLQLPDIDIDFETKRRDEVIAYIIDKYKGKAVQVASYGMYKVLNLVNDIIKLYDDFSSEDIALIKKIIYTYQDEEKQIDLEKLNKDKIAQDINKKYKNFLAIFNFEYNKVKYLGTHAAGVAVSKNDIYYYTAVRYDKTHNKYYAAYNLVDLERCGIIKYDILGLSTLSSIEELRKLTNNKNGIDENAVKDEKILKAFNEGNCNGIFQFDSEASQDLLRKIQVNNFNDVIATSAMNRPGPLSLKIPDQYIESKVNYDIIKKPIYHKEIDSTYGCILYQEQIAGIAIKYGGMTYDHCDKMRKMDSDTIKSRLLREQYQEEYLNIFINGMKKHNINKEDAEKLFESFMCYSFNKGHATGYALISLEEMFYKVYFTNEYWYTKIKYTGDESKRRRYKENAVRDGCLFFLAHINYSKQKESLRKIEDENIIQEGLSSIKGVGGKAAEFIYKERKKNGIFVSYDDFISRCKVKGSPVNKRVIETLVEQGALEFNKKVYLKRVKKYNSSLYGKGR